MGGRREGGRAFEAARYFFTERFFLEYLVGWSSYFFLITTFW